MLILKIKIMPESPETNLNDIKKKAEKILSSLGGKLHSTEEQPIAFGLKALIIMATWPEDKGPDALEEQLSKMPHINSSEIIDVRRAVG